MASTQINVTKIASDKMLCRKLNRVLIQKVTWAREVVGEASQR